MAKPPDKDRRPAGEPEPGAEQIAGEADRHGDHSPHHRQDRCCTCCGWPTGLTVPDEWRRWALDYGHTIGSREKAA